MAILYIHHSLPAQFANLITYLADRVRPRSAFLAVQDAPAFTLVDKHFYRPDPVGTPGDRALTPVLGALGHGRAVARRLKQMADDGFRPRLIVAHPGWGALLHLREVFPSAALVVYCENFHQGASGVAALANMALYAALDAADVGVAPTRWQRSIHPLPYQAKIRTVHDGIDTLHLRPDPLARFELPDLTMLSRGDRVVTFVARGLEPTRGFPELLQAVPRILEAVPSARIVIAGGDRARYGPEPEAGGSWRAVLLREMGFSDPRVHFVGHLRYADFIRLMQVSTVHVYPSRPFVLSWSVLEAMSIGAVVVAARNPPVEEVIEHGRNGLLCDATDPVQIAATVVDVLRAPEAFAALGRAARETVVGEYDVGRVLPRWVAVLREVAPGVV